MFGEGQMIITMIIMIIVIINNYISASQYHISYTKYLKINI